MSSLWQWAIALLCVVALLAARGPAPAPAVSGAASREAAAKHMGAAHAAPMPPHGFPPIVMTPDGVAASAT